MDLADRAHRDANAGRFHHEPGDTQQPPLGLEIGSGSGAGHQLGAKALPAFGPLGQALVVAPLAGGGAHGLESPAGVTSPASATLPRAASACAQRV